MRKVKESAAQTLRENVSIGTFLVRQKAISEEDLRSALEQQKTAGVSLEKILTENGIVSEDDLNRAIAAKHGIEFVSLRPEDVDPTAAHLVPEHVVRQYRAIPIKIEGERLLVAMESPLNLAARDEIALLTGYEVVPLATTRKELAQAVARHFSVKEATKQEIVDIRLQDIRTGVRKPRAAAREKPVEGPDGAVVRLVDSIITGAIRAGASDIHLEPQQPEMRVRYRIDGILHDIMNVPKHVEQGLVSRIKIVADIDITERRRPQDGHISVSHEGRDCDLRVSTMPTVSGEKVVMRLLDNGSTSVRFEQMGLSAEDMQTLESLIKRPYGMLLITGPTGSGKTTTLYGVLRDCLNSSIHNIITIEDPVEYHLPGINQIQVDPAVGMTFATGLRTILRQDPDIIMVGEIRDRETAEIAVHAALTGHLVFSTLHTNDTAGAITRLAEMGVPPFLIASSVLGVVAQRLMRTICPDCKEQYVPAQAELAELYPGLSAAEHTFSRGKGCQFCYQTGYRGRMGVFEILRVSERVRSSIAGKQSSSTIKRAAIEEGMRTLLQRALEKVTEGVSTLAEIRRVIGTEDA